jgi:hypothetical protein
VNIFTIMGGGECNGYKTYTTDADFTEGTFIGGIYTENDQLQLTPGEGTTYPVMWIANNGEATVSKWDTDNNVELARYPTWFGTGVRWTSHDGPGPSRTCVDVYGNCYVANRHLYDPQPADVIKFLADDWIDRNGNGVLDTSWDVNGDGTISVDELLPMEDTNGNNRIDPGEIMDERVAWAVSVGPDNGVGRSLSIDPDGNIWLGLYNTQAYYKLSGVDGSILAGPIYTPGHTPYGSLVDKYGILWGASLDYNLLKLDTKTNTFLDTYTLPDLSYGIALGYDNAENTIVYLGGRWFSTFVKFNSSSEIATTPAALQYETYGIATDAQGNILAGNGNNGEMNKFAPDGSLIWHADAQVPSHIRGTVVDSNNDVWALHLYDHKMAKFDGDTGAPLGIFNTGAYPYTYSDATGLGYSSSVVTGTWSVIRDNNKPGTVWDIISWTSDEPEGTNITVKARSSEDQLTWSPWEDVTNNIPLISTPPGRYIEIDVTMKITSGTISPELYDITIEGICTGEPEVPPPEGSGATIDPDTLTITLPVGGSTTEHKTVILDEIPIGKLDVLFVFDLTGSMSGVIDEAKANSIDIMNDIKAQVADSAFGVGSFMDYPDYYTSCDYSSSYGSSGDYPWNLDQSITTDTSSVSSAVNGLPYGSGDDGPESYSRALYESQFAGWRVGSRKVIIIFEDNIPHDCDFSTFGCSGYSTGTDPGRDAIANTADDLPWADVVSQLKAAKISVVAVDSGGGWNPCPWLYATDETGGIYTLLGDDTLPDKIVELIGEVTGTIHNLTFEPKAGYENWFTWDPEYYEDVEGGVTVEFNVTITVPEGTSPGLYHTWLMVMGDGSILAVQEQWITVTTEEPEETYDLSGTIYYNDYIDEGVLMIVLFDEPVGPDTTPIDVIDIYPTYDFPEDYTFHDLAPGTYYVAAQIDFDYSGGHPSPGELDGYAINKTSIDDIDAITIIDTDVTDVNITLFEVPFDGLPASDFVGYWKFDEGTGGAETTTADASGHGRPGTLFGTPNWVTGKVGNALQFDSSGDYVKLFYTDGVAVSNDFTLMAWVNAPSATGDRDILVRSSDSDWLYGGLQLLTKTDGKAYIDMHSGGSDGISSVSVRDDTWHHVVGVRDTSGNMKIYVDGVQAGITGYSGVVDETTFNWFIGATYNGGYFFNGLIDEVAIFDRVLTNDEIQLCYNNGLAGHGYMP